ncbi:MAG TPA: di-heme oxidoredictase family protein [Planctomycetota bacterium]|nr:di-heme oxidoredictase family protein [Planctomycetota bacterium]
MARETGHRVFPSVPLRRGALVAAIVLGAGVTGFAILADLSLVGALHAPAAEHADQAELTDLVAAGQAEEAFEDAFEDGDELFETPFNALDGGGANVGAGQRFTRVPRADLAGAGEWANHVPSRATGPNAEACTACHNTPMDDGAGLAASNVHRDPLHSGNLGSFIQRNTPHVFGMGGVQRLAEEMTEKLQQLRAQAAQQACATGTPRSRTLTAKGVNFGSITAIPGGNPCTVTFDTSNVVGVDADLVVRPFQWKGSVAFIRDFNRGAAHNELGMQAVEVVGEGVDGDADGVVDEMTVGDMTAMAVYLSAQPRPTTKKELNELGLLDPPLTGQQVAAISQGKTKFNQIGCTSCHKSQLSIDVPIFKEPSANPSFRDAVFPAGQNPLSLGLDPANPVSFDLTADQPDNRILDAAGNLVFHLGAFQTDGTGAVVRLLGDLKRHDMGPGLAESIDEVGTGASTFLTENLWGVGSTAPYLHDGRATTLTEAILDHGGEALAARNAFAALPLADQEKVIAFLENQVLFKLGEE